MNVQPENWHEFDKLPNSLVFVVLKYLYGAKLAEEVADKVRQWFGDWHMRGAVA